MLCANLHWNFYFGNNTVAHEPRYTCPKKNLVRTIVLVLVGQEQDKTISFLEGQTIIILVLDKNKIRNGQYCPDKNKTRLEKVGQV